MPQSSYLDDHSLTILSIVVERLTKELLEKHPPSASPIGIMLGGQPASGKTTLIQHIKKNVYPAENFFVINGDEYRVFHPHYYKIEAEQGTEATNFTQPFANEVVSKLKNACLENKISFIIEGTLRTFEVPKSTTEELLSNNFTVELHVLAVSYEESLLGIFKRYEKGMALSGKGRFSPISSHDEAYRAIPLNCKSFITAFSGSFTSLHLYKRVDNGLEGVLVTNIQENDTIFESRKIPSVSKSYLFASWSEILEMAAAREAPDFEHLNFIENKVLQFKQ